MFVNYVCLDKTNFEKPVGLVVYNFKGGLVLDRFDGTKHEMSKKDLHRFYFDVKGYKKHKRAA